MKSARLPGKRGSHESPPVWGAWIEMPYVMIYNKDQASPPVWGAWIEIVDGLFWCMPIPVAPRMGGVD